MGLTQDPELARFRQGLCKAGLISMFSECGNARLEILNRDIIGWDCVQTVREFIAHKLWETATHKQMSAVAAVALQIITDGLRCGCVLSPLTVECYYELARESDDQEGAATLRLAIDSFTALDDGDHRWSNWLLMTLKRIAHSENSGVEKQLEMLKEFLQDKADHIFNNPDGDI